MIPDIGVHYGVPFEVYRTWEAANNSTLKHLRRSVGHARYEQLKPGEQSKEMRLGTAEHLWKLERAEFFKQVVVAEVGSRKGRAWEEVKEQNPGKLILLEDEFEAVKEMGMAISRHEEAREIAAAVGDVEVCYVWQDAGTGLLCKARADKVIAPPKRTPLSVDLKTTSDASEEEFSKTIWELCYHTQLAFQDMGREALGLEPVSHRWIVVENKAPWGAVVYQPTDEVLHAGRQDLAVWLHRWAEAVAADRFPFYPQRSQLIDLPPWAARRYE